MKYYLTSILIIFCLACSSTDHDEASPLEKEIINLKSTAEKRAFLKQIFIDDQKVRGSEGQEIMIQYGQNSEEHMAYIKRQWKQDEINLKKVEKYLELYGHPKKDEVGGDAAGVPWIVIHHTQGYDVRKRNFNIIYDGYQNGDIDDGAITFYLGRMYEIKNGHRMEMKSPYTTEDEINALMQSLELKLSEAQND